MKNCPQCGKQMTETIEEYQLMFSSASPVTEGERIGKCVFLSNTRINRCHCGESIVSIPKIEELHRLIDDNPKATVLTFEDNTWHVTE